MPQLWRSNSSRSAHRDPPERPVRTTSIGKGSCDPVGLMCPPLMIPSSNGCYIGPFQPSSPTDIHQHHPPKYDQLLNELRHAQERRGRLQDVSGAIAAASIVRPVNSTRPLTNGGSASPPPLTDWRKGLRPTEPPGDSYVNHFNSSGPHYSVNGAAGLKMPGKVTVQKRVRFLEDGTGNLHTSVFGGSADSLVSSIDLPPVPSFVHDHGRDKERPLGVEDIDSLITSLTNFDAELKPPTESYANRNNALSKPLGEKKPTATGRPGRHDLQTNGRDVVDGGLNGDMSEMSVVDQRQMIVHLEPDDPNSVDSGSVLSELDFEETSSTITDTYSVINSPDPDIQQRNDDLFAEVSELLERSLQEIQRMEEDTTGVGQRATTNGHHHNSNGPVEPVKIREPLYELIGWKRNPPLVQLDLKGSKPFPLPSSTVTQPQSASPVAPPVNNADIWVPRADFVPPSTAPPVHQKPNDKVWLRRPATNGQPVQRNNPHHQPGTVHQLTEGDNPIYGRLWEAASQSPAASSRSSTSSGDDSMSGLVKQAGPDQELSVIRSMARKARMEHWKMTGIPGTSPTQLEPPTSVPTTDGAPTEQTGKMAALSSLPVFRISKPNGHHVNNNNGEGIQLTWPPPPLPPSGSSSLAATPSTPTLPAMPTVPDNHHHHHSNGQHSPKCFGHQRAFQWPIPALKIPAAGSKKAQPTPPPDEPSLKVGIGQLKPGNLEAAQDWYWTEEFPKAAGLEPGTGAMSSWFHGAISRWEAERRLDERPVGAFLARLTERLWGYALSVRNPSGGISHFLIDAGTVRRTGSGNRKQCYTLLGSSDPPHKTLRELIQYYGKHALTPDGMEKLLFPCPQETAVPCTSPNSFR